jgi:hypothetical protein
MKWRCGTYQLTARSRLEGWEKRTTVTVSPNRPAVWDTR